MWSSEFRSAVIPGRGQTPARPEPMDTGLGPRVQASVNRLRGPCVWVPGSLLRSAPE
jgi:hypothetical protein